MKKKKISLLLLILSLSLICVSQLFVRSTPDSAAEQTESDRLISEGEAGTESSLEESAKEDPPMPEEKIVPAHYMGENRYLASVGYSVLHCRFTFPDNDELPEYCVSDEESSELEKCIAENRPISVLSRTPASSEESAEYELYLTTLPVMEITTQNGEDIGDEDIPIVMEGISGTAHIRGRTSSRFAKKNYKIELDEKVSFLGMRRDDDWVLYGAYNDQERVRNVFSSNLWYASCCGNNALGVSNGDEYKYVELIINGRYAGLYALGYKPDQKQFNIREGEYLFMRKAWKETYDLRGSLTKENESDALEMLHGEYLEDEASSIDLWLFIDLCFGSDNTSKNTYFALKILDRYSDSMIAIYCPWDLDYTWGNLWCDSADENFTLPYGKPCTTPCRMGDYYVHDELKAGNDEMVEKLRTRYNELRADKWSTQTIMEMIDECEDSVFHSGAYARDIERWKNSTQMDPALKMSLFREYVSGRLSWMDETIENLEDFI